MKKLIFPAMLAAGLFSGAAHAETIQLVCQTAPEHRILAFGTTFHVTLNMTDRMAWDDVGGGRSRVRESGDYVSWEHAFPSSMGGGSATLKLDRRTLELDLDTGPGQAYYQCRVVPPRQF
jgi:hypothetical protein